MARPLRRHRRASLSWHRRVIRPLPRHRHVPTPSRNHRRFPVSRRLATFLVSVLCALPVPALIGADRTTAEFTSLVENPTSELAARSSFYAGAVVALSPISYWRLGESSGSSGVDVMGRAALTYIGSIVKGEPGVVGRDTDTSVRFTADGDYARAATLEAHRLTTAFSVVAWVRTTTMPQPNIARIVTRNDGADYNYHLAWNATGTQMRFLTDTTAGRFETSTPGPADNQWHMHAGTFDGTKLRLYRDGVLLDSQTVTGTLLNPVGRVHLGAPSPQTTKGHIDEVAVWGRALGTAELASLYTWATT
jgi:hypothetical protein